MSSDIDAQIKATQKQCIEVFKRTWRELNPEASTPEELASEIENFSSSAFRFMFTNFPITKHAQPFPLWLLIFTAVLESHTHPTDLVKGQPRDRQHLRRWRPWHGGIAGELIRATIEKARIE
jgi:hypothetical protein